MPRVGEGEGEEEGDGGGVGAGVIKLVSSVVLEAEVLVADARGEFELGPLRVEGFEEVVEELEGRSVEELLICDKDVEIPFDLPSLLIEFDSDNFALKSR